MRQISRWIDRAAIHRASLRAIHESSAGLALALAGYGFCAGANASVIFNDNLKTSTINSATPAAPTSSSTNYDILSTKAATNSTINNGTGDLTLKLNSSTTSGFVEMEGLFSTDPTPFALVNPGDKIEYDVTFTDTASLLAGGTSSYVLFGLYNSEGGNFSRQRAQ